jgi:regulator of protease activity HflC (stomatin/prohibitin superfamily)
MELGFGWLVFVVIGLYLVNCIKILAEYERGVIFRLGRLLPRPKGPGLVLIFAPIDRMVRMSLRVETMEVPSQDVVTKDNVTVKVSAVVFFRVIDPQKAVVEVAHYVHATSQLAQTRLRSVLGEADLDELLSQREKLNARLQGTLDEHTGPWGIKVQAVEVKHVDLPEQMIRAIARQAEAERERRAKVIHAEGELQASSKLTEAAEMLAKQPVSVTLRYLQTLTEIGAEKNTTVVFPLPLDVYRGMAAWADQLIDQRLARKPTDENIRPE